MTEASGAIWWNELMTRDVNRALSYYERVAGWRWDTMPSGESFGDYHLAVKNGRPIAGCVDMSGVDFLHSYNDFWLTFVQVEDCDLSAELCGESGGSVLRAPFSLPNVGRVAIVADTNGALHGLITPSASN